MDQPHLIGGTICILKVQYKLLVGTMSRPNHDLGFGPILRGALEGLGFQIKCFLYGIVLWYITDRCFLTALSVLTLLVFKPHWSNLLGRHSRKGCSKTHTLKNDLVGAMWRFGLKGDMLCTNLDGGGIT